MLNPTIRLECVSVYTKKEHVLKEKRSSCRIDNPNATQFYVVKVDGCAITSGIRCDFLVIDSGQTEYYIELKGSDVEHAFNQIINTMNALGKSGAVKFCYVVSTKCPMVSTKLQIHQKKFKNNYKATLVVKNKQAVIILS